MSEDEQLLTITGAARRLGIHQNTLRMWANKGIVPHIKLPSGHRRFTISTIERLRQEIGLAQRKEQGEDDPEASRQL